MFSVGDYVVYGSSGVCKVENVGPMQSPENFKGRVYYTLMPVYMRESKIITPANSDKVKIRSVISKKEAMELIENIEDIDILGIGDEKKREVEYKEAMQKCNCRDFVRVIKTIYLRKKTRTEEGKKITAGDEKYFSAAEDGLYGELAIPLNMDKEDVRDFIMQKFKGFEEA